MTHFRGVGDRGREYYPYVTRSLLDLYNEGALTNVVDVSVEPDYGYVARITYANGSHRITYGNDLGLNSGAACELARDKGHSKFLLRTIGVACPDGDEFLLPWWADKILQNQRMRGNVQVKTTAMARGYIEESHGYPVFVKPVDGSKGADIYKVHEPGELTGIFALYAEKRVRVAMVEEQISMPDYRVVTLDGEPISAYRRTPLTVIGNGKNTVRQLVDNLQERYLNEGRDTRIDLGDPRITQYLRKQGVDLNYIPAVKNQIVLTAVSNLSSGGMSEDVTEIIAQKWVDLAAFVAKSFSLRLCGLDLACSDITDGDAEYSVIEVNAAPGLDHYASSGEEQEKIVRNLYAKVLNAFPAAVQ